MRLILKLLIWVWPFLISVIFNDRPVMEVIGRNRLFTLLFILLIVVSGFLFYTTNTLSYSKSYNATTTKRNILLQQQVTELEMRLDRIRRNPEFCPPPTPYDAQRIIDQLFP